MSLSLEGRAMIVTGAAQGLGRAEAIALARRGAGLVLADVQDPAETLAAVSREGGAAVSAQLDLGLGEESAQRLLELALSTYGELDGVVNNAGVVRDGMCFNLDREDWEQSLGVNLSATFYLSREAARHWRQRRRSGSSRPASIVNTSSESGLYGNAGQANYAAAKAGVAGLTVTLAAELDRYAVRVNAIAPRARTPMSAAAFGELPAGDGVDPYDPERVAAVVAWLCGDAAAEVSGQVLVVHGAGIEVMEGWSVARSVAAPPLWSDRELLGLRDELFPGSPAKHLAGPVAALFEPNASREEISR